MRGAGRRTAARSPRSATTSRRSTGSGRPRRAHILDFPRAASPARATVTLERNYRSTQPLLDVANAVAAQDARGVPEAPARRPRGRRAGRRLVFCRDEAARGRRGLRPRARRARGRACCLREQAVLARTGHDSDLLELELSRRRIPFVKYGGLRYLEAAHVKDFLAMLRLADNAGRRDRVVPRAPAARGRRPGRARGVRSTRCSAGEPAGRSARCADRCAPRARRASRARRARCADAARRGDAQRARDGARRPGRRAPSACATRSPRSCAAHYLDGAVRVAGPRRARAALRSRGARSAPLRRRARARPAGLQRRPRAAAAPRRRLPRALDDPLGQGPRVAVGAPDRGLRRQLPGLHVGRARASRSTRSAGCSTSR